MKYWCVSDRAEVLDGLRLCGIGGVLAAGAEETLRAVDAACADPDVAVLLVTDGCCELCRRRVDELRLSAERPLVNVIAGPGEKRREADAMTRLINEAIGVKI